MTPLETFSSIANPDGKYYPFLPREQVPYAGDPKQYGFKPEHLHFRSVAPPPPPAPEPGEDGGWNQLGSSWGDNIPGGGGDDPGATGPDGPNSDPGTPRSGGPFANYSRPTLDKITDVAELITSPLGRLGSVFAPGGLLAQGLAHGALAGVNRAKSFPRENKDTLMPSLLNPGLGGGAGPSGPGAADPGSHGATGGFGPGGMGGRSGQAGPDPTGGFGPGGMGGGNGGGVGSASGDGPGGSAGMGDSDGAASGTWHQGGPVYDGDPTTYGPMWIKAHENEYVLPPYVVDAFGVETLDAIRKALAPQGQFQRGSGEMMAMPETIARHGQGK